jgi:hypothetical protein
MLETEGSKIQGQPMDVGQVAGIQAIWNNSGMLLMGEWNWDLVASKDAPTLSWFCTTNVLLVGSMCTILVRWKMIFSTKVTALIPNRFEDVVGSHANQPQSSKKLVSIIL